MPGLDRPFLYLLLALALLRPDITHPETGFLLAAGGAGLLARWIVRTDASGLRRAVLPALVALPFLLATHLFAADRHANLRTLVLGIACAGVFAESRRRDAEGRIVAAGLAPFLAAIASLLAVHAFWQWAVSFPDALRDLPAGAGADAVRVRLQSGRPFATLLLPATLATFLAAALPLTLLALSGVRARLGRAALFFALPLQAAGVLLTRSLTGLLAVSAAALVASFARPRGERRVLLAGVAVLLVGGAVWAAASRGREVLSLRDPTSTFGMRLGNAAVAVRMIGDHPLAGVGNGGFGLRYPSYMRAGMNETRWVHNAPLQLAAENGVWILAPLALLAHAIGRRARAAARGGDGADTLLLASVAGFCAAFLVDFGLHLSAIALPFFAVLGAAFPEAAAPSRGPEEPAGSVRPPLPRPVLRSRLIRGAAAALLAVAVAVASGRWAAGSMLRERASAAARSGDRESAEPPARAARAVDPRHPDSAGLLAFLLFQDFEAARSLDPERPAEAILAESRAYAEEALRLDPWTPRRHEQAAFAALRQGDVARALRGFHRAAELFPLRRGYREERDRLLEEVRALRGGSAAAAP